MRRVTDPYREAPTVATPEMPSNEPPLLSTFVESRLAVAILAASCCVLLFSLYVLPLAITLTLVVAAIVAGGTAGSVALVRRRSRTVLAAKVDACPEPSPRIEREVPMQQTAEEFVDDMVRAFRS